MLMDPERRAYTEELDELPVTLVQPPRNDRLTPILWKINRIGLTNHGQLGIRGACAFNFGTFILQNVDASALLKRWHVRKDFDEVRIEDVLPSHRV